MLHNAMGGVYGSALIMKVYHPMLIALSGAGGGISLFLKWAGKVISSIKVIYIMCIF